MILTKIYPPFAYYTSQRNKMEEEKGMGELIEMGQRNEKLGGR